MQERETFGSRIGFILVSAGCAVGLGNVWKFPYICGEYGGAAFILIYLVFLVILGLPIMLCEFAIGRGSHKGMSKAFEILEAKGTKWHNLKWLSISGSYLLMMFYTMVGGWMISYVVKMASGSMSGMSAKQVGDQFETMLASPGQMTFWMVITIILAFFVCGLGLQNGIEKVTKVMMSVLLVLMLILAVHSITMPNSLKGIKFYLIPNFKHVLKMGIGKTVYAAMSHAFFTLSVGMGAMEIFGSYLKRERTLFGESVNIILLDTFVALTAGFIIIPACFSFGVKPDAGPSLLFITLPNLFNSMKGGRIWGVAFFVFMSFAALSTIMAVFENIISFYMDTLDWERKKTVVVNGVIVSILSLPAVLGYNILSGVQPMGAGTTIMDLEDFIVSYNLLPLGSIIFVLFCVRKNGWSFARFLEEVNAGEGVKIPMSKALCFYMSYILPAIIVIVYLKGYYDTFSGQRCFTLIGWMAFACLLLAIIFGVVWYQPKTKKK